MSTRRSFRIAAFACAAGLVGAACAGSGGDDAQDTAAAPVTATAEASTPDNEAAPAILQFTAPLIGGGEIDASELADKPTAFWFWSPT